MLTVNIIRAFLKISITTLFDTQKVTLEENTCNTH